MKNTMCLALIVLAVLPAAAQNATNGNCSSDGDAASALGQDYAARVDGLLREVHGSLQRISVRTEVGELTPEQERDLKLAATREMISRLDALSAVYDARLDATIVRRAHKVCTNEGPAPRKSAEHGATRTTSVVSVEELKRQAVATTAVSGTVGAAR